MDRNSFLAPPNQTESFNLKSRMYLQFCDQCKQYTLKQKCPRCGGQTRSAHPARFSPEDKNSAERIQTKAKFNLLPYQQPDIEY